MNDELVANRHAEECEHLTTERDRLKAKLERAVEALGEANQMLSVAHEADRALREYRSGMDANEAQVLDQAITTLTAASLAFNCTANALRDCKPEASGVANRSAEG
jgi:hypothetical protein